MSTTAEKIKELRDALGQTRDEFAKRFSVTYFTVRDWEQGRLPVASERLIEMANLAFRVDNELGWFFLQSVGLDMKGFQRQTIEETQIRARTKKTRKKA